MPNGDVPLDGGLSVTAGIHDIITFAFNKGTIGLYSFSAFQMLTAIEKTLSCPKLMEEEKEIPPPPGTADGAASRAGSSGSGSGTGSTGTIADSQSRSHRPPSRLKQWHLLQPAHGSAPAEG